MEESLKALLPVDVTEAAMKSRVLSCNMAGALFSLQCLVHRMGAMSSVLDIVSNQISCPQMVLFYKPMSRLATMTQFKKLMRNAHQVLSTRTLDVQLGKQVCDMEKQLVALRESSEKLFSNVTSNAVGTDGYQQVTKLIQDAVGLRVLAGQLPQTPASQHWPLLQDLLKTVDKASFLSVLNMRII